MIKQQISKLHLFEVIFPLAFVLLVLNPCPSRGQTINVSLNLFYSDPINGNSGGTWELVAKSSHFGISGLDARLTNITSSQNSGPRATVNGGDPAGFSFFFDSNVVGYRDLTMGQVPIIPLPSGKEQTVFYGVGTLINGAPSYPGKPPGTNSISPEFTSLTSPQAIPWATGDVFGDPVWNTAARLASGTFGAGVTPNFFPGSSGNVFTTLGTSTTSGVSSLATSFIAIVRTNLFVPQPASCALLAMATAFVIAGWRRRIPAVTT